MRLVFVNHMHPDTPHISGVRSWFFARELAARGHQVVQICERRDGCEVAVEPEQLARLVSAHQWRSPLLIAVRPQPRRALVRQRSAATPVPVRKTLVAWNYLRHSGMFTDFSDGVQPYLPVLAREFQPEVVWGVFGNTDCWLIAQRLARLSACAWIGDMKDSWEVFMRRGLRGILARRFHDMAASTANAEFNARVFHRWFPFEPAVVYSGVDAGFLQAPPSSLEPDVFRLTLTGSVHDIQSLHQYVQAFAAWLARRPAADRIRAEVIYAGGDIARVQAALESLNGLARVVIHPYLALPELAAICRSATINSYIWNPKGFHHKLLELLFCGRPVIAYPGETEESRRLAATTGGTLQVCRDAGELHATFDAALQGRLVCSSAMATASSFSWPAQAVALEQVLHSAVRRAVAA
jgi:glycosyltransferase involved in cell wall biosynthesis